MERRISVNLLPESQYNSMQNQYRVNFRKRVNHSKNYNHVLLLLFRNGKEHQWVVKLPTGLHVCSDNNCNFFLKNKKNHIYSI